MPSRNFDKYIIEWLGIWLVNSSLINSADIGGRGNPDALTSVNCQKENQEKMGINLLQELRHNSTKSQQDVTSI